jgi:hypothetical protein
MKTYITYNAGCNIWTVEEFNATIDWHNNEYQGTKAECEKEANYQMNEAGEPHYSNAEYESIYDY